jgi:pyridoxine 5-phosphate synthase
MVMNGFPIRLGVNIDHVATLRRARGTVYPSPLDAAALCQEAGAHGITVHLREDRRHIRDDDVYALKKFLSIPLNLEMSAAPEIVNIALDVRPPEVCLVPERREELTTEGGLDVAGQQARLFPVIQTLLDAGCVVSLFIEADEKQLDAAHASGVNTIELHTGAFCDANDDARARELTKLIQGARYAASLGLRVNAGHGINMDNIADILRIPHLDTLNIGHSIVSRAVLIGMRGAVTEMMEAIGLYRGGEQA